MVPHSKSIRFPRSSRRNTFCADMRKVRWNFPYVESNRNYTNRGDYRNRLTSVTKQEFNAETQEWTTVQILEYTYDYNNVWIRKIIGNEKTIFIPENYQTTVQIDNNTVSHHYLWTPNQQDKLLADTTSSDILWSLTDHLGTIRDIIGDTNATHLIYDAFGNLISGTNPTLFGYTGKAFDIDAQLQNNVNRWYDATVGRWLSTDPIGFEGNDTNLYRYVGNCTYRYVDTMGKEKIVVTTPEKIAALLGVEIIKTNDPVSRWIQACNCGQGRGMMPGKITLSGEASDSEAIGFSHLVHELLGGPATYCTCGGHEGKDSFYHDMATYYELGALASKAPTLLEDGRFCERKKELRGNKWNSPIEEMEQFVNDCRAGKMQGKTYKSKVYTSSSFWYRDSFVVKFTLTCNNNEIESTFFIGYTRKTWWLF